MQLRLERRRQLTLNDVGVGSEIHEQPSSNHAVDFRQLHTSVVYRLRPAA
jgi:hypothetical protein